VPSAGHAGSDDRGDQRSEREQTEPLMDLQHVRPSVESRLILGTALGLFRRPRSPSEGRTALPEKAARARSIVCLAPAASVTLPTLAPNPSAETETS
jgi:hypothetical protein